MNNNLKSLLTSAGIILFYVFATIGIVKLLWNTTDMDKFEGRVRFLVLSQVIFFFIYIISVYHMFDFDNLGYFYAGYFIFQAAYVIVGLVMFVISKPD